MTKTWQIPEGKVKSLSIGGNVVWKKEEIPDIPETPEETVAGNGTWLFNKTLSLPSQRVEQVVDFYIHNLSIGRYELYHRIVLKPTEVAIGDTSTLDATIYDAEDGGWGNEFGRDIVFDGEQTVSKEFYDWLVANATFGAGN